MLPQEVIAKKRDGGALSAAEIDFIVDGITDGSFTEAQIAAFAMAVFFRGLTMEERIALTRAMTASGRALDWRAVSQGRPVLDKHSTGGIGDKTSLILAPVIAALGGLVPMISGRGLGHTGGTLDKLDTIPGYNSTPDIDTFINVVDETGLAIIGQTPDLTPADRRFYAVRDVTATVESIDLITASILSKKLAAGLDGLVLDVKFGDGAFLTDIDDARGLAQSLVAVANGAGLDTVALLTDMNQVLGHAAGNALEVMEVIKFLTGDAREPRLAAVTQALTATLLKMAGLADDKDDAAAKIERTLAAGAAAEAFQRMVHALGGPADLIEKPDMYLRPAPHVIEVPAPRSGWVQRIGLRDLGWAIVAMGGGRAKADDIIDPRVGMTDVVGIGDKVEAGAPLATIHVTDADAAAAASARIQTAIQIGDHQRAERLPLVLERVDHER